MKEYTISTIIKVEAETENEAKYKLSTMLKLGQAEKKEKMEINIMQVIREVDLKF